MERNRSEITQVLAKLGLSEVEINLYLYLNKSGARSALEISKAIGVSRTNVYRSIDILLQKGLVEEQMQVKSSIYSAADPSKLVFILDQQRLEFDQVQNELRNIVNELEKDRHTIQGESEVRYFKGIEGIRQVIWNALSTKDEVLGYGYLIWFDVLGKRFTKRWHDEAVLRGLQTYEITNLPEDGTVWSENKDYVTNHYHGRYIPLKKLKIDHEINIYNDTYSVVNYVNGEYFGVEINNKSIATLQKQLFWMAWEFGIDMEPFGPFEVSG